MQFCIEPGLTIFVPALICAGFGGGELGGAPMGIGPPGPPGPPDGGPKGGNGGIYYALSFYITILYENRKRGLIKSEVYKKRLRKGG